MASRRKRASETSREHPVFQKPKKAGEKEKLGRRPRSRHRSHLRKPWSSFDTYFSRVLKHVHVGLTLSRRSLDLLDSFVKDMFERIATEASTLVRKTKSATINGREIQSAVQLVLPGELCLCAVKEGTLALFRYITRK